MELCEINNLFQYGVDNNYIWITVCLILIVDILQEEAKEKINIKKKKYDDHTEKLELSGKSSDKNTKMKREEMEIKPMGKFTLYIKYRERRKHFW